MNFTALGKKIALDFSALVKPIEMTSQMAIRQGLASPIAPKSLNYSALQKADYLGSPLGLAVETVKGIPAVFGQIGQQISRNIASMGITIGKLLGGTDEISYQNFPKVFQPIAQTIFTKEPIKSIEDRVVTAEFDIKKWGEQTGGKLGDIAKVNYKSLAFIGVMGSVGIDLTPFGGLEKNAFKALIKTKTAGEAVSLLLKMGVADDLARQFATDIVKVADEKTAKALFNNIANLQKTTKVAPRVVPEVVPRISPKLQPLAQEAIPKELTQLSKQAKGVSYETFKRRLTSNIGLVDKGEKIPTDTADAIFNRLQATAQRGEFSDEAILFKDISGRNPVRLSGDKMIITYRSAPNNNLRPGDFVSFNKNEAGFYTSPTKKIYTHIIKKSDLVAMEGSMGGGQELIYLPKGYKATEPIKYFNDSKSFWEKVNQAAKGVEVKPIKTLEQIFKEGVVEKPNLLPAVIQGDTFTLGTGRLTQPTIKEARVALRAEIKATKAEIRNTDIAFKKAQKLELSQQKVRQEAIDNINTQHGDTERIIESLEKKNLSPEDIANVILEDGTKLTDTLKVKRNPDKSLAAVITKDTIEGLKKSYTEVLPPEKWAKIGVFKKAVGTATDLAKLYELPAVYFEKKGLSQLYDPIIEAGRGAEVLKQSFITRFRETGLWKNQGWFTADRFNLSKTEGENIGKYFLSRQGKGYKVVLEDLSPQEQRFVEVFDGIIKDTEPRFFEVAKKNGKTPGVVKNYAPIMTDKDIELIDKAGAMDFIFRKHPAFFSLKERAKQVPVELYETDYRNVAARWMDGISQFLNYGENTQELKYLIDSEPFKEIVSNKDYSIIYKWLKDISNPQIPETAGGQAVDLVSRLLRKGSAIASLGLNYASVVKQALTQIPLTIIEKALPKLTSQYAKAFGIDVSKLPSITKRAGDIAITDLQGKVGRIFTGALTEFDRKNAQISLNALLDKYGAKAIKDFERTSLMPSRETLSAIEKIAQDKIDLWYGGFFKGQKPEAFRSSLGQFINMFIYPLTSQLNGFYRSILTAKGAGATAKATAEVMAAATAIAYAEVAITKLSFQWSDEKEMTKDVLQSLLGNIPIISQISYALMEDQQLQVSAGLSGITNLGKKIPQYLSGEKGIEDILIAGAEVVGLPKQIRRIWEGMEIINEGGILDKEGKMLAPVKDTDEIIRSILRGKYGSLASQDWIRNIGESKENRRWFVPQVEFLQNGDYTRKAELYRQFTAEEQKELRGYLSEAQQKKLDKALKEATNKSLESIFSGKKSLETIFK